MSRFADNVAKTSEVIRTEYQFTGFCEGKSLVAIVFIHYELGNYE